MVPEVTLSTACPKPLAKFRAEKFTPAWWAKVKEQQRVAKEKAIAKQRAKPRAVRKPIAKRNEKRIARKYAAYRKVLASAFHKKLRYAAYERSGGLCECESCRTIQRSVAKMYGRDAYGSPLPLYDPERITMACTTIPIWFANGKGEGWQRFRSDAGELHHDSYAMFGDENPDELTRVRFVWKECHKRIESEHGTRRRYLAGHSR